MDNELILKRDANGCVFLKDNLCSVYEGRPTIAELSEPGSGRRLHRQPDVADRGSDQLLPHRVNWIWKP